jgi:DNA-damage-inducible protein J
MSQNAVVRARIDQKTKEKAELVLEAMGLTVSDAFRVMMKRIANDGALPFSPLIPNKETIEAMQAADRGEVSGSFNTPEEMFAALMADSDDADD